MGLLDWFKRGAPSVPVVTIGMTTQVVEKMLGKPRTRQRGLAILRKLAANYEQLESRLGDLADNEYAIYDHPAGTYEIVYRGGRVVEIHSQPTRGRWRATDPPADDPNSFVGTWLSSRAGTTISLYPNGAWQLGPNRWGRWSVRDSFLVWTYESTHHIGEDVNPILHVGADEFSIRETNGSITVFTRVNFRGQGEEKGTF
jgi:hypothetical protein